MKILHGADWHIGQFLYEYNYAVKQQQVDWLIKGSKIQPVFAMSLLVKRSEPY